MVTCREIEEKFLSRFFKTLAYSIKIKKEIGFNICKKSKGQLYGTDYCIGEECSLPPEFLGKCFKEEDIEIANFHTHPGVWPGGGMAIPSYNDILFSIFQDHNFLCVGGRGEKRVDQKYITTRKVGCWEVKDNKTTNFARLLLYHNRKEEAEEFLEKNYDEIVKKICIWEHPIEEKYMPEIFIENIRKSMVEFKRSEKSD